MKEMVLTRERMVAALAGDTGQSVGRITTDIDRDFILRGPDAVDYGLVDRILEKPDPVPTAALR